MAEELLGVSFDIHGGGSDLVFPHHENEAAQTRCGRGAELTQVWMHNGMLQMGEEKMAKSVGNVASLHDVLEEWGRDALIVLMVSGHYRQPLQFDRRTMEQATSVVQRLREVGRILLPGGDPTLAFLKEEFLEALANDFNTADAMAKVFQFVKFANQRGGVGGDDLRDMLDVFGLANLLDAEDEAGTDELALLEQRQAARGAKNFAEADRLRDELRARGWEVRDGPDGAQLVRA